jgi:hypothetical protein
MNLKLFDPEDNVFKGFLIGVVKYYNEALSLSVSTVTYKRGIKGLT